MRAKKGSRFEREICKRLSEWWSPGRSDIFWRSSQSGGRATLRSRKGLRTHGSYGDIAAVDPIGEALIKVFTIELKRGSSHKTPGDLVDCSEVSAKHPFAKALLQVIRSHTEADSYTWMLIGKRDHKCEMVYIPTHILKDVVVKGITGTPCARYKIQIEELKLDFIGVPLEKFLKLFTKAHVFDLASQKYIPD